MYKRQRLAREHPWATFDVAAMEDVALVPASLDHALVLRLSLIHISEPTRPY